MSTNQERKYRRIIAALAALCLALMLFAPILSANLFITKIDISYLNLCRQMFTLNDSASILGDLLSDFASSDAFDSFSIVATIIGLVLAIGAVSVTLAGILALLPDVSQRTRKNAAIIGAAIPAVALVVILVACVAAKATSFISLWLFLLLIALGVMLYFGTRLTANSHGNASANANAVQNHGKVSHASAPAATGLTGNSGALSGAWIPLATGETLRIGRDPSVCNLIVEHQNSDISRSHCTVRVNSVGNGYLVTDYSRNGTFWTHAPSGVSHALLPKNVETSVPRGALLELGKNGNSFRLA